MDTDQRRAWRAIGLLLLCVTPLPTCGAPTSVVRVTEAAGRPVQGIQVSRNWHHYGLGDRGDDGWKTTGPDGVAIFGKDAAWGCAPRFALMPIGAALPHTSSDRYVRFDATIPDDFDVLPPEGYKFYAGSVAGFRTYRDGHESYYTIDGRGVFEQPSQHHWSVTLDCTNPYRQIDFTIRLARRAQPQTRPN